MINDAHAESAQLTNTVVMISPDSFQYNYETATTNSFQNQLKDNDEVLKKALSEFHEMVNLLRAHKINVITLPSRPYVITPDAVFPNNWFSTHELKNGNTLLIVYPMLHSNRRVEKQVSALKKALIKNNIHIDKIIDLSSYERHSKALEGTGSIVLDRQNKIAFASLSPRTHVDVLNKFAAILGYKLVKFTSYDKKNQMIYHTNVVMSVGEKFAVLCESCVENHHEKTQLVTTLTELNKTIISISPDQTKKMAGNILQLYSTDGKSKIVLSKTAYDAFTPQQRKTLARFGELLVVKIPTIEAVGGGSARCMLAEIF